MKRLLSILLLIVCGLPFATAPLLAMSQGKSGGLPACCRRAGAHHCTGSMVTSGQETASNKLQIHAVPETCPYQQASIAVHTDTFAPAPSHAIFASMSSYPSGIAQTESKWRISRDRSRQKRGPPASPFSL